MRLGHQIDFVEFISGQSTLGYIQFEVMQFLPSLLALSGMVKSSFRSI